MRGSRTYALLALGVALLAAGVVGRLSAPKGEVTPTATSESPARLPTPRAARVVAGVRVGYSRTRAGAVAAMAAYGQALADPRIQLDDRRRTKVASAVGTQRYAQALERAQAVFASRRAGAVGKALRPGARAVFLGVPVAFRIISYDGSTAVIRSWGVAIVASDTGLPPEASWGTTTTTAVWRHGDWKVDAVRAQAGPAPAEAAPPSPASSFIALLSGMSALRHAP
jgi:hypothetical protein